MSRFQINQRSALRRWVDLCLGVLSLVAGLIMIFTPGPAILFIPAGLALLGREFRWARRGSLVLRRRFRKLRRHRASERADPNSKAPPPFRRTSSQQVLLHR